MQSFGMFDKGTEIAGAKAKLDIVALPEEHDRFDPLLRQEPTSKGNRTSVRQLVREDPAVEAIGKPGRLGTALHPNDRVAALFKDVRERPSNGSTWLDDENPTLHDRAAYQYVLAVSSRFLNGVPGDTGRIPPATVPRRLPRDRTVR